MAGSLPLPCLSDIAATQDASPEGPLANALATLFEPSPSLYTNLVPALAHAVRGPRTYHALVDDATREILSWPPGQQVAFVGAHPRIGEVSGLSALSAQEQASRKTPTEVFIRLGELNVAYERKYEGLRYITFVNGRSQQEIMEEMEEKLGVGKGAIDPATLESVPIGSTEWETEVRRAVEDVGRIAKARLAMMGVSGEAEEC
ncbi:Oxo-4-hydroxy-4-carboxy-5-ureidoimidazoline decarboxylase [Vararia minispora EC-137]|uniref:Oxo-4-hydroxy-4-carboxy-5-ureidoimidazoline decarboxylase n=1 Tax=Vararia minispora EC-137 TaxID=1314806 RepID=A0ACB8QAK2_9AGAM|nr:Oxo-4-hydroxy-4-carboxy-5-ureidoimidazoline decarboxylase [Vararia minispora EC-137]